MRRSLVALALLIPLALTGCGSDSSDQTDEKPKTITVTINGDSVTPNGDRIKVAVGQEIDFKVTSDRAAALHVHSSPEQTLDFGVGTTSVSVKIDKPGVVEVETSDTDTTVVQLQVE